MKPAAEAQLEHPMARRCRGSADHAVKAVDDDGTDDEARQCEGDDDLARDREEIREHPEKVSRQNEHEQREHEGEENHPFLTRTFTQHGRDKFVGHFRNGLHATRDQTTVRRCEVEEAGRRCDGSNHEKRRICERKIDATDVDRDNRLHQELMSRIVCHRLPSLPVAAQRRHLVSIFHGKNGLSRFSPHPDLSPARPQAAAAWPLPLRTAEHSTHPRKNREGEE